mmetsp:Transcript_6715/g.9858  ORF Transcript_6715/g.9858 Transcript_6715/m.9858 type:complete len:83 (-) Transcript_6715:19-267(-)
MWCVGGDGLEIFLGEEEFDHGLEAFGGIVPEDEETPVEEPGALLECFEVCHFLGVNELFDGEFDGGEGGGCFLPVLNENFAG